MQIVIDIPKQDYIYIAKKHCLPSCDDRTLRKNIYEMIVNGTPLEQEPKTGHWIMTNDYLTAAYESIDYVKCSCCGEDSLEEGDFCPNCGAKMLPKDLQFGD
jgi:hypothetical protein